MINLKSTVKGRYRLSAIAPDGTERRSTDWFDNLITNNGLDLINAGGYLAVCAAGSDSTTPAFTDTQLGGLLGSTSSASRTTSREISITPYYLSQVASFSFSKGAVVGNVAEVGVGASTTNLLSRALVVDGSGNPTTITVLSDEILQVDYEFRFQILDVDTTGTFTIDGTTYTWSGRASEIDNGSFWDIGDGSGNPAKIETSTIRTEVYDGAIGAITESPTGITVNPTSASLTAYTDGDYQSTCDFVFDPAIANFANGVGAIQFRSKQVGKSLQTWQIGFSPKIPKTNLDELTLTVSYSWGRA